VIHQEFNANLFLPLIPSRHNFFGTERIAGDDISAAVFSTAFVYGLMLNANEFESPPTVSANDSLLRGLFARVVFHHSYRNDFPGWICEARSRHDHGPRCHW